MDSLSSLAEFFYNLIPGSILVSILMLLFPNLAPQDSNITMGLVAVSGVFLGFIFQGWTKVVKESFFSRNKVYDEIKVKNPETFKNVRIILKNRNLLEKKKITLKEYFYKIDNYLRGKPQSVIIDHFAAKAALWSNMFWVSVILIFITFIKITSDFYFYNMIIEAVPVLIFSCSILCLILSIKMAQEYWESQYNVVLSTFLMVSSLDLKIKIGDVRASHLSDSHVK